MKIKEMLNNVGAVSKQVVIGSAIGVATLAVGIGLMNNFTSNGSVEQGFASNALERSSYSSTYAGASAEDIISVRDYNQGGREGTVSAITGTENLAFNKRTAAAGTAGAKGASAGVAAGEGAALEDDSTGYGSGEIEGMGTSNQISVDITQDMDPEAKAQAQRNAKIAKGQAYGEEARATLQTSKMASSGGIGGSTGSSSMSYNMSGANAGSSAKAGQADSSKVALAQAQLGNVNLASAKAGRLDGMGANGSDADGKRVGRAAVGQNYETIGDLGRATKYSQSAKNKVGADNAQAAADASAAFDGSKATEVTSLQGENLQKAASSALKDMGSGSGFVNPGINFINGLDEEMENIEETMKKYEDLQKKIKDCFMAMVIAASIASLAVFVASKSGPWGPLIAGIAAAAGTVAILASQIAAYAYLGQISKLAKESGIDSIKPSAWDWTAPWLIGSVLAGAIALSFLVAYSQSAIVTKFILPAMKGLAGTGAMSGVTHFFNRITGKK